MLDRLTALAGAGVITVGVSVGLLAGAGVAAATTEADAAGTASSSESSPSDGKRRSGTSGDPAPETETDTDTGATDDTDDADDTVAGSDGTDGTDGSKGEHDTAADVAESEAAFEKPAGADDEASPAVVMDQPEPTDLVIVIDEPVEPTVDLDDTVTVTTSVPVPEQLSVPEPTAEVEPLATQKAVVSASQAAAMPPRQTLLSLIGTAIFTLYSAAIRVLGGAPQLPPGSAVTVRSSTVQIDCGQGYEVPADWYVPEGPTPTRLILLQHGFLASGAFYSYTAARLAEATRSIVVATSLTSNFLSCDGCWVGGSPMHKAIADLFADGDTALAHSALAAGYGATLLDGVQRVVLVGHSAGGGLAAGAAAYMTENGTFDELAGVVMLDGVGFGDVTREALAKLPQNFPIYNLGARAYFWNMSGTTNTLMNEWRPSGFNGVKLAHGSHGDSMSGGNPLIQASMNLVTGWPRPENARATEVISAAWINDMFSDTPPSAASGFYGAPGQSLEISTDRGTATAHVLPGPTDRQTIIDWIFTFFSKILFGIDFATCAADPGEAGAQNPQIDAPNTASSLDGTPKPGQSIGQYVCTG